MKPWFLVLSTVWTTWATPGSFDMSRYSGIVLPDKNAQVCWANAGPSIQRKEGGILSLNASTVVLSGSVHCATPPFNKTVLIAPDIIVSRTASTDKSVSVLGLVHELEWLNNEIKGGTPPLGGSALTAVP